MTPSKTTPSTAQQDLPLRDIHLPDPVSWWPPSPWLWLLIIGTALLVFVTLRWVIPWLWRRYHQRAINYRPGARCEFASLERQWQDGELDCAQLASALNQLLRRLIATERPHASIGDTGEAWLQQLAAHFELDAQPSGATAYALTEAAYRADPDFNADAALADIKQWLSGRYKHSRGGRHAGV